jgi:hypothetical protein
LGLWGRTLEQNHHVFNSRTGAKQKKFVLCAAAAGIAGVRERLDGLEARWREHEKQLAEEAEQASWELVNALKVRMLPRT